MKAQREKESMAHYKVPIIIERFEVLHVDASTLDSAITMVEDGTQKGWSGMSATLYDKIPSLLHITDISTPHINIDWDVVDGMNEEHDPMPKSDNELYGDANEVHQL